MKKKRYEIVIKTVICDYSFNYLKKIKTIN